MTNNSETQWAKYTRSSNSSLQRSAHVFLCFDSSLFHSLTLGPEVSTQSVKAGLARFCTLMHYSLTSLSQHPQHCTDISAIGLQVALELGSYIGYSAITQARKLPAGGKLYGIELDPTNVRITREMVQHAGLSHKVEILKGELESSILVGLLTQHVSMSSFIFAPQMQSTAGPLLVCLQAGHKIDSQ